MRSKSIIAVALTLSCLLISAHACATDAEILQTYLHNKFPAFLQLTPQQIEQLSWNINNKVQSFDLDQRADRQIHIEVSRALTRLYCLQLLHTGGRAEYEQFVAAQLLNGIPEPLSFASFNLLAQHIQQLNPADLDLLQTATILSAVSLSAPAAMLAQRAVNLDNINTDNLNFMAATVRADINIYPLTEHIKNDSATNKKILYILFPPQTNMRHMLYAEGGAAMFRYLRTMIKHQYINRNELDLWYAYWIVNIAGFRGHVDQHGSLYLNEPVFKAMYKLKDNIYTILQQPNYDPLIPYLEYRAELLGLQNLILQKRLTLAHLGAMLRLYTQKDGVRLEAAFNKLPTKLQKNLQQQYTAYLQDATLIAPTHVPALFGNALNICNDDLELVMVKIMPVYAQALQEYAKLQRSGAIKPHVILSFNKLSASFNVRKILYASTKIKLKVSTDGEAIIL